MLKIFSRSKKQDDRSYPVRSWPDPDPDKLKLQIRPLKRHLSPARQYRLTNDQNREGPKRNYWTSRDSLFIFAEGRGVWFVTLSSINHDRVRYNYSHDDIYDLALFMIMDLQNAKALLEKHGLYMQALAVRAAEEAVLMGLEEDYREILVEQKQAESQA